MAPGFQGRAGHLALGRAKKARSRMTSFETNFCAARLILRVYGTKSLKFQVSCSGAFENAIKLDDEAESLELGELGTIPCWLEP